MRTFIRGCLFHRSLDEFTNSSEHIEERDLDYVSLSEYTYAAQSENHLRTQQLPINQAIVATTSATSSENMLVSSPFTIPDISHLEVSLSQPLSANINSCGVFNNYLFRQDPTTGHLSLVPVQVRAPDSLLGLDINLSLIPQPLQELITVPESTDGPFINCLNVPERPESQDYSPPSSYFNGSSFICDRHSVPRAYNGQTNHKMTQGDNQSPPVSISSKVLPALQEVIDLLKGQFSLDGYLDNEQEDIAMGMYLQIIHLLFSEFWTMWLTDCDRV